MSGRRIVPRALPRTVPVLAALTLATVLTTGCSTPEPHVTRTAEAADDLVRGEPAPSAASPYWVDPNSDAARQVRTWEKQGRETEAKILRRISGRPVADWPAWDDPAP
ncbi:endoglucanase, partial [Streptomyces anulatus]